MENRWMEVSIETTQEAIEPVSNLLNEMGTNGVLIEDSEVMERDGAIESDGKWFELNAEDYPHEGVIIKGYFSSSLVFEQTIEDIKLGLRRLSQYGFTVGSGAIRFRDVHEEDWANAWKKYYKPTRMTERITISPTWEKYVAQSANEIVIELDPGMAFGTGTHPTTVLCIEAIEKNMEPGDQFIDLGCGSGILSIAAAKLGARHVLALDIDPLAVQVTKENTQINMVSEQIDVHQNDLLDGIRLGADILAANILAEVILQVIAKAYDLLNPGGCFIVSGIIERKEESVREALLAHGFRICETLNMDGWVAIIGKKESRCM